MSNYAEYYFEKENCDERIWKYPDMMWRTRNMAMLTGTVYDAMCEPAAGAVVKIDMMCSCGKIKNVGYVVTDDVGEFAVMVKRCFGIYYLLTFFNPIIAEACNYYTGMEFDGKEQQEGSFKDKETVFVNENKEDGINGKGIVCGQESTGNRSRWFHRKSFSRSIS